MRGRGYNAWNEGTVLAHQRFVLLPVIAGAALPFTIIEGSALGKLKGSPAKKDEKRFTKE
jgi:hypothetical protein